MRWGRKRPIRATLIECQINLNDDLVESETHSYRANDASANVMSTPKVQYSYADGSAKGKQVPRT